MDKRTTIIYQPEKFDLQGEAMQDDLTEQMGALLDEAQLVNLEIRLPNGRRTLKVLRHPVLTIGTGEDCELIVPEVFGFVSRRHFQIRREQAAYTLTDLGSTNGTFLNGEKVAPGTSHPLQDRDSIRVGEEFAVSFVFHDARTPTPAPGLRVARPQIDIQGKARVIIGRNPASDVPLDSPAIAWEHVTLSEGGRLTTSEGGVKVNGQACQSAQLRPGDQIEIADFLVVYQGESLTVYSSGGYRLDLIGGSKAVQSRGQTRRLLDDIHLSILPHEFVALVGGSGAGKSTLMDGLNGFRPIQGRLIVNNRDFYRHYDEFRPLLGYVPQYDILPRQLTVETALRFVARLRLPRHVRRAERERRITEALDIVEMNSEHLRKTRIGALSGGQRKRVSIAAELLADPKLFFLDEPTSGLDPGLEKKMMLLLRRMADQGRTIILITHATSNIIETDHVAFLTEGRLAYFGPPSEAGSFFGVPDFPDIYDQLGRNPTRWPESFRQNPRYQTYITERQAQLPPPTENTPIQRPSLGEQWRGYWHQFTVFAGRNLRLTLSDPVSLFVGLIVMPFVALIMISATQPSEMIGKSEVMANPTTAAATLSENYLPAQESHIIIFGIAILSVLVGAFAGSNDLLKERSIYLRERMVNLKIPPYLASKYLTFAGFAALQTCVYLLVLGLHIEYPDEGVLLPPFLEMWITVFLIVLVGYAFGLLISAVSINNDMALYLVLIVVFFQYISAGAIYNVRDVQPAEAVSYLTPARWGTIALGTTVDVQEVAQATILCGETPDGAVICQNDPLEESALFLPYGKSAGYLVQQWGYLLLMGAVLTLMTYSVLRLYDRLDLRLA